MKNMIYNYLSIIKSYICKFAAVVTLVCKKITPSVKKKKKYIVCTSLPYVLCRDSVFNII